MTKSLIVKLFWGSLIGLVAGLVLMAVSCGLAITNGIFIMNGPDVTGIKSSALSWTLLGLMGLSMLVLLLAAVTHFVAWIGAVLKGLLGFVFIPTIAYVIAGPDGLKAKEQAPAQPQAGAVGAPTRVAA